MAKAQTDHLFQLIKSMSRSEKRNFRLYTGRAGSDTESKFIRLFEVMDKQKHYDEEVVLQKVPGIRRQQLPNLKAHLYKQLLKSLRQKPMNIDAEMQLHEQMDFAKLLYNKGLYKQALKTLGKGKDMARQYRKQLIQLEIIEFEKLIELQYITRSTSDRAAQLVEESEAINRQIGEAGSYSNLALQLYDYYLKRGHVKSTADLEALRARFDEDLQRAGERACKAFFGRLHLYQAYVWYHYIAQDFLACYKYAQKWVALFHDTPDMLNFHPDIYLKGVHNLLRTLYRLGHFSKFTAVLHELEEMYASGRIPVTRNNEMRYRLYFYTHLMNLHFLKGTFTEGLPLIKQVEAFLQEYRPYLDAHRIMVFYFKIASMYFGSGEYHQAVRYLNRILQERELSLRRDIQVYAHLLNLITHFELGNEELIEYQVKSTYRFLAKLQDNSRHTRYILAFLRKLSDIRRRDLEGEFHKLHHQLMEIKQDPYEKRDLQYLDIISWLESKMQKRPVQEIIQEKARKRFGEEP